MVERKGLLNQEQIKALLGEVPFDLLPAEIKQARLDGVFDSFDSLPGNAALQAKLKGNAAPVAGIDGSGRLVKAPV